MTTAIGNIILATGGTIAPVDKMRVVTNKSRGTTGAKMAEYLLEHTANKIQYIVTGSGMLPFIHRAHLNPLATSPEEIGEMYRRLQESVASGRLDIEYPPYFDDYRVCMESAAQDSKSWDVAIIAAAVSDYGMKEVVDGKISSDKPELSLDLVRLPKIIDLMRQRSRELVMVGFKLLPDEASVSETRDKLIQASLKQMSGTSETDMVIANSTSVTPGSDRLHTTDTLFVYPDGNHRVVERSTLERNLLEELPDLVANRRARNYLRQ